MVAVGDVIADVCERIEHEDATGFAYRGSNLRYAAERALFGRLSNNESLRRAHAGGAEAVSVGSALEAAVATELVTRAEIVVAPRRSAARVVAGDVAWRVRHRSRLELPEQRGGVWFLIDHAKFLRFVDPLVAPDCGVLSLDPATTAEMSTARTIPFAALDGLHGGRPPARKELG